MQPDAYISSGVLELYVAGVLSPDQAAEVETTASKHPTIREEIERLEHVYQRYAELQAPELAANVLEGILERIQKTPEQPMPVAEPVVKKLVPEKKENVEQERRVERHAAISSSSRSVSWGRMLAAAVILLAISGILNFYLYRKWQKNNETIASLEQEKSNLADRMQLADNDHKAALGMLAMYEDTGYRHVMMKGQAAAPHAMAMVFWNKKEHRVYLSPKSLPPPPSGKQYQLWAIMPDGKAMDAGVVPPEKTSDAQLVPMKNIMDAEGFALTLEPMGGSPSPTQSAIYARGAI